MPLYKVKYVRRIARTVISRQETHLFVDAIDFAEAKLTAQVVAHYGDIKKHCLDWTTIQNSSVEGAPIETAPPSVDEVGEPFPAPTVACVVTGKIAAMNPEEYRKHKGNQ